MRISDKYTTEVLTFKGPNFVRIKIEFYLPRCMKIILDKMIIKIHCLTVVLKSLHDLHI